MNSSVSLHTAVFWLAASFLAGGLVCGLMESASERNAPTIEVRDSALEQEDIGSAHERR